MAEEGRPVKRRRSIRQWLWHLAPLRGVGFSCEREAHFSTSSLDQDLGGRVVHEPELCGAWMRFLCVHGCSLSLLTSCRLWSSGLVRRRARTEVKVNCERHQKKNKESERKANILRLVVCVACLFLLSLSLLLLPFVFVCGSSSGSAARVTNFRGRPHARAKTPTYCHLSFSVRLHFLWMTTLSLLNEGGKDTGDI